LVVLEPDLVGRVDVAGEAQRALLAECSAADDDDRDDAAGAEEIELYGVRHPGGDRVGVTDDRVVEVGEYLGATCVEPSGLLQLSSPCNVHGVVGNDQAPGLTFDVLPGTAQYHLVSLGDAEQLGYVSGCPHCLRLEPGSRLGAGLRSRGFE